VEGAMKNKYKVGDSVWAFHTTIDVIIGPLTIREIVGGSGNSYICSNPEITLYKLGHELASDKTEAAQLCKLFHNNKTEKGGFKS